MSTFTSKSTSLHRLIRAGLVLSSLFGLSSAYATSVCVNSPEMLQLWLNNAQFQTQSLELKLVQGTYNLTSAIYVELGGRTTLEGG